MAEPSLENLQDSLGRNVQGHGSAGEAKQAFVVIGMHRSGTSAMARVLALSGASLPANMLPPQVDNPAGFWEPKELVDFNEELLVSVDSAWDDVFAYDPRPFSALPNDDNRARALQILSRNYNDAPKIVIKDPRISLIVPFWNAVLQQAGYKPTYILMLRNPLEVADSLRLRDQVGRGKAMMLWAAYMLAAERGTRGLQRVFASYSDLLSRPSTILDRIEKASGLVFPRRTRLSANEIDGFLDEGLRHHRLSRKDILDREDVWPVLTEIYDALTDASVQIDPAAPDFSDVERRMEEVLGAVGNVVAELRAQLSHVGALLSAADQGRGEALGRAEEERLGWSRERSVLLEAIADADAKLEQAMVRANDDRARHEGELEGARSSARAEAEADIRQVRQETDRQLEDARGQWDAERTRICAALADEHTALETSEAEQATLREALGLAQRQVELGEAERHRVGGVLEVVHQRLAASEAEAAQLQEAVLAQRDELIRLNEHAKEERARADVRLEQTLAETRSEREAMVGRLASKEAALAKTSGELMAAESRLEEAVSAGRAAEERSIAALEEANSRAEADADDWRETLAAGVAEHETALKVSEVERRRLEEALQLAQFHADAAQAELERQETALGHAHADAGAAAVRLEAVEQGGAAQLKDALGRWTTERSALMDLLTARDFELTVARSENVDLARALETSRQDHERLAGELGRHVQTLQAAAESQGKMEEDLGAAQAQLQQISSSRIWSLTKPFRGAARGVRRSPKP